MKRLSILGSTGSIGVQTLDVVRKNPDKFQVVALAARRNIDLMEEQVREFRPRAVCLAEEDAAGSLGRRISGVEVYAGEEGLAKIAASPEAEVVVSAIVGGAGLMPTLAAIEAGKDVAIANKEPLVMAGRIMTKAAKKSGAKILPIDSEHSAIWQSLKDEDANKVKKLILTASGGPFRNFSLSQLYSVTKEQALKHPNWKMGAKVTVDSATLMNKGLETIEARWLFGLGFDKIDVIVHPESVIHSMVEFTDGSIIAQLGTPDMRTPIGYALSYPERLDEASSRLDLVKVGKLTFEPPDVERFLCLKYAREAGKAGGTMPAVLNAANEVAVNAFLQDKIGFMDISEIVRSAMDSHKIVSDPSLSEIMEADSLTREYASGLLKVETSRH